MNILSALTIIVFCMGLTVDPPSQIFSKRPLPENVFYADKATVGDRFAGMVLASLDYNLVTKDAIAQFSGKTVVTGSFTRIPEDDEFFSGVEFTVDAGSIDQSPVLATDERDETGFFFSNENIEDVLTMLGNPGYGSGGRATIVIKEYCIRHVHKEITDTATLVKVVNLFPQI